MKNSQIAEFFVLRDLEKNQKLEGSHFFIDGNTIYSYGYHFPIAVKLKDGFLFNSCGYSMTTAKHKGYVKRAIGNNFIIELSTEKLKNCINDDIKSIKEVIIEKL